jgi:hypothetical protein
MVIHLSTDWTAWKEEEEEEDEIIYTRTDLVSAAGDVMATEGHDQQGDCNRVFLLPVLNSASTSRGRPSRRRCEAEMKKSCNRSCEVFAASVSQLQLARPARCTSAYIAMRENRSIMTRHCLKKLPSAPHSGSLHLSVPRVSFHTCGG